MKTGRLSISPWVLLLLCAATVLLFARLDNGRLWQDEAETAFLGKTTLRSGYPNASDGLNRLNPLLSVRKNGAWTYHSWLPMYAAAGSFRLFGPTTWAARFPFALMGLLSLWVAYLLFRRLIKDPLTVKLAVLTLALSVPFLLHMRQCRYYAPAVLGSLWAVLAYWRFLKGKKFSAIDLAAALIFLFHSDHGVFAPVLGAFLLDFLASKPEAGQKKRGALLFLAVLAATVPWIIYLDAGQHHKAFSLKEISHHFQFYFRQVNKFVFPLFFWGILCAAWWAPFKGVFRKQAREWRLVFWVLFSGILFLVLVPEQRHFRYLVYLIPFLALVQAALLAAVIRAKKPLGIALAAVLLGTSTLHYAAARSLPLEFIGELTHSYRGPVDAVIELLEKEATPGQTLKAPYEEHPVLFYTPFLKVEQIVTPQDFEKETYPDWIVLRKDWVRREFLESPYYREIRSRYTELVLDGPDIPWQNRPDPGYHKFRTDDKAPRVVVFRRER